MELTLNQQQALKTMQSGSNIFLSGAPGSGKSNLISKFIAENNDKNIIICAPTSITDGNFGGDILRGVFGIPAGVLKVGDYNPKPCDALKRADIIIIEKINMCRIDVFEYVVRTLQNLRKKMELSSNLEHYTKQVILVGNFHQVLPMLKHEEKADFIKKWGLKRETDLFAFNSSLWDELELQNILLEKTVHPKENMEASENPETDEEPSRVFTVVSTFYNDIVHDKAQHPYHLIKISATDYDRWDSEEDALLLDEWSRGLGIDEISKKHNRTVGAIRARLIRI